MCSEDHVKKGKKVFCEENNPLERLWSASLCGSKCRKIMFLFLENFRMSYQSVSTVPSGDVNTVTPTHAKKLTKFALVGIGLFFAAGLISSSSSSPPSSPSPNLESQAPVNICSNPSYSKTTLKLSHSQSLEALFLEDKGEKKFEASDVTLVDDKFYAIADNSWSLYEIDQQLPTNSDKNIQLGPPRLHGKEDSGFEGLVETSDPDVFYIMRESVLSNNGEYHAVLLQVRINDDRTDYNVERTCESEVTFDGDSKGFEGAAGLKGNDGQLYILGLCEGNHCKEGDAGKDKGNGKVVIMQINEEVSDEQKSLGFQCVLRTRRTMSVPESAFFQDYSALSINENGDVAITSQEESQLWIGKLKLDDDLLFDVENSEFVENRGTVLDFPRDTNCEIIFCNIEGIHWINDELLVAVSDKMKSGGKQDFRCLEYDQSIHVFIRP